MPSTFNGISFLNRLVVSAGAGVLAIVTGACSESDGTNAVPANTGVTETAPGTEAEPMAPETQPLDGENSDAMAGETVRAPTEDAVDGTIESN